VAPILSVRNLSTGYGKKQVLFDVSLDVMPGEILLITGGNGSGKSTLLKAIYGLLLPWNARAQIFFRPNPTGEPTNTQRPTLNLSKGLAYLPQKNAVFENLSVEDNLRLAGDSLADHQIFAARRAEVLIRFPLLRSFLQRKPEKMSGGERQVTALAMLFLNRPRLLLLDEPTAGLDGHNAELVLDTLNQANRDASLTLIVVEHRRNECAALGGKVFRMRLGKLEAEPPLRQAAVVE
jgi:branched-chain amino acid transport system ATP-binding protein